MAAGVTIHGLVDKMREEIAKGDRKRIGPLANASLTIEGGTFRKETKTDAEGRYQLSGLSPGKIKVTLTLPENLTTFEKEEELELSDRGCGSVNFYVFENGRVSGTVFDPEGQPVPRLLLALVEGDKVDPVKYYSKLTRTDDLGRYSFSGLPPGRYVIAVNLTRYPQPNDETDAFPRTFYPGVSTASEAEVISLAAGEELREKDFRLPNRRAPSIITGKVVWDDGQPVTKANISTRDVTYHDPGVNNGVSVDEQGYFTIKGYVGQTLLISASSNRPYTGDRQLGPMERAEPLRITLTNPTEMVKIVITRLR